MKLTLLVSAGAVLAAGIAVAAVQDDAARVAAVVAPAMDFTKAEAFEVNAGGGATSHELVNSSAFSQPSANMSFERSWAGGDAGRVAIAASVRCRRTASTRTRCGCRGDGRTLVVANGGLLMDDTARDLKLNLSTMDPSLVYLDTRDGTLRRQVRLARALHKLSIRHLAIAADGAVAVAMQYEGPAGDLVPLVGLDRGSGGVVLLEMPQTAMRRLKNYCGSAAVDAAGRVLAVSSPRGAAIAFWDLADNRFLGLGDVADGCGLAASAEPGSFIASSGVGGIFTLDPRRGPPQAAAPGTDPGDHWDNHITPAMLG